MNKFKELASLAHAKKAKINAFYENLESFKTLPVTFSNVLNLCESVGLKPSKELKLAILQRFIALKEEALKEEFKRQNKTAHFKELKHAIYDEVVRFYEDEHLSLINEAQDLSLLEPFYIELLKGVHHIGRVMNKLNKAWTKHIIEKNNELLQSEFASLKEALHFLKTQGLYQKDRANEPCERSYGVLLKIGNLWKFTSYASFFENEFIELEYAFDELLNALTSLAQDEEQKAYLKYLKKLKAAFLCKDNDAVIAAWQEAELAWLEVKAPLQVAHPLEYYEDNYTHAVAMEWDLRLSEELEILDKDFGKTAKKAFSEIYTRLEKSLEKSPEKHDESLFSEVCANLDKTQLYICLPLLYYGAQMNGLFSAQVVPNDEFVSAKGGKKIFAFVNFVYESAKAKPFMRLASEIFSKDFLTYGREILFLKPELWKKVYEISTIGHEFGHIFFIAQDSEKRMNESGVFKNIEEFKATAGGLLIFFLNEKEELKLPVFHELIKRAVSLIAWQQVEEVKPYYTEGLIHLSLLFESGVLKFTNAGLSVDFSSSSYERFKALFMKTYEKLAMHYALKKDAKDFLSLFCELEDSVFLPLNKECRDFVKHYYALYEQIGGEVDMSGEFERFKAKSLKNLDKLGDL